MHTKSLILSFLAYATTVVVADNRLVKRQNAASSESDVIMSLPVEDLPPVTVTGAPGNGGASLPVEPSRTFVEDNPATASNPTNLENFPTIVSETPTVPASPSLTVTITTSTSTSTSTSTTTATATATATGSATPTVSDNSSAGSTKTEGTQVSSNPGAMPTAFVGHAAGIAAIVGLAMAV